MGHVFEDTGPKLARLIRWVPGEGAIAQATCVEGSARRSLVAVEACERLSALLGATAQPQAEVARRLSPDAPHDPVALLVAIRSARVYLAVDPGATVEVESTLATDQPGELVVVRAEVRTPTGERAAKAELQYLIVPGAGEHSREAQARQSMRARLLADGIG